MDQGEAQDYYKLQKSYLTDKINDSGSNYTPTNAGQKCNINASPSATPTNTERVNRLGSEKSNSSGNFVLNK